VIEDEVGKSPDNRLAQLVLLSSVAGVIGFVLGAANSGIPATQTASREANSSGVAGTSAPVLLRPAVEDASTLGSSAANETVASPDPPQIIPSDTTSPRGGALHEYLRERHFVVHEANRETGIVEWQHEDKALSVLGRFGSGNNPIFDRKVLQLVVNERGNAVLTAERVAMHDGTILVGTGNSWQPLLPAMPSTQGQSGTANSRAATVVHPAADTEMVNGWRVKAAPLPESTRRRIYCELCRAQDTGTDDQEAYSIMAKRYGIDEDAVYAIAGEGAVKQWPLPPAP
jgi:hypothetical protein